MDGFRLVKLNEVIRQVDIVITCTGQSVGCFHSRKFGIKMSFYPVGSAFVTVIEFVSATRQ